MQTNSSLAVIMYHYVGPAEEGLLQKCHRVANNKFRSQLDYLQANYQIIDPNTFINVESSEQHGGKPLCLLTFDDGLADHFHNVAPELEQRGLRGTFFVTSGQFEHREILPVHQLQMILANCELSDVKRCLREVLGNALDSQGHRSRRLDGEEISRIKDSVQRIPEPSLRRQVVDELWDRLELNNKTKQLWESVYMTEQQVAKMQQSGHVIGNHTHTHPWLSSLEDEGTQAEIELCSDHHIAMGWGSPSKTLLAYPYGDVGEHQLSTIREIGISHAFTTSPEMNVVEAKRIDPGLLFGRFDTIDEGLF